MDFNDMPWLITVSGIGTFGPIEARIAEKTRDELRRLAPERTIQAWAAQAPNMATIEPIAVARGAVTA